MKRTILLGLLATVMFYAACGPGGPEGEIKAVLDKMTNAARAGDYEAYKSCFSKDMVEMMEMAGVEAAMENFRSNPVPDNMSYEVTEVEIEGDTATATVKTKIGEVETETSMTFVKEDGAWKMSGL